MIRVKRDRHEIIKEILEVMQGEEKTYSRIMNKVGTDYQLFRSVFDAMKANKLIEGHDRGNGRQEYTITKEGLEYLHNLKEVLICL